MLNSKEYVPTNANIAAHLHTLCRGMCYYRCVMAAVPHWKSLLLPNESIILFPSRAYVEGGLRGCSWHRAEALAGDTAGIKEQFRIHDVKCGV